jgi:hypothetical protein
MKRPKFIGWINSDSLCFADTPEAAEAKVMEWVNGAHFCEWGTFPVRVRVTTYATQRPVSNRLVERAS